MRDLDAEIGAERARRKPNPNRRTWHYWLAAGRPEAPSKEYWCDYCAGWYGVPHDQGTHVDKGLCRNMGRSMQCACIDCWVYDQRQDKCYS